MNFKNFEDYYAILEVDFKATTKEIKDSYKRLALKFHPDKNKNPDAENYFKKIKEAYEVLNDHEKRETYNFLYKKFTNYRVKMSHEDHETEREEYGISKEMIDTGLLLAGGAIAGTAIFYGLKFLFGGNNPNENNEDASANDKYNRKKNGTHN